MHDPVRNLFQKRFLLRAVTAAAAAAGFISATPSSKAANGTWTNTSSDSTWHTTSNWQSGTVAEGAGSIANITANIAANRIITIDGASLSPTIGTLNIGDTNNSNTYTIASSTGTLTFNNSGSSAALNMTAQSSTVTLSTPIMLADNLTVTNNSVNSRTLVLSGLISTTASRGLTITAGAGVTLSAANTFTGGVTLNSGVLNINNGGSSSTNSALGTGTFSIGGGSTIGATGSATVTLATNNAQIWNGNFALAGSRDLNFGTGTVTLAATPTITVGSRLYTVGGVISGAGFGLTFENSTPGLITGAVTLSGANTYTGVTTVNGAVVRFNAASSLPANGANSLLIGAGGAVVVAGPYTTLAGWIGDGRLSGSSTGALALTGSSSNNFTPGASYPTLSLGANRGATVNYTGTYTPSGSTYYVGGGSGTINFDGANAFIGANNLVAGNGGGGVVSIGGSNSYTGSTTVNAGTLAFASIGNETGGDSSLGNPAAGNGTIAVSTAATPGAVLRFVGATSSTSDRVVNLLSSASIEASGGTGATLTLNNSANAVTGSGTLTLGGSGTGVISKIALTSGGLIKAGASAWTLTAPASYPGSTTVSGGTLVLGGGNDTIPATSAVDITGSSTINLQGSTQSITGLTAGNGATAEVIGSAGSLLKVTAGSFDVAQASSGSTTFNLSGLPELQFNSPTGDFRAGAINNPSGASATLILAQTNTITAKAFGVSDISAGATSGLNTGVIQLGQTNVINADSIQIGDFKSDATLTFRPGLTNPTVKFRATDGTGAASLHISLGQSSALPTVATMDLSAGITDASFSTIIVGENSNSGTQGQNTTGTLRLGAGTLTATSATLGLLSNSATNTTYIAAGTLDILNGGTAAITTITLSQRTAGAGISNGTINLTDGFLKAATLQKGTAPSGTAAFNWNGGTIANLNASTNLTITGVPLTLVDGVADSSPRQFSVDAGRTVTVNSAIVNGAAVPASAFTKAGDGLLQLAGASTYTGMTTIAAGTLAITTDNRIADTSPIALTGGTFATNGFSDAVGPLSITAGSTIDLGSGASVLAFANSSGQTWTSLLTIQNWSGNLAGGGADRVIFGASASALTPSQLAFIQFAGYPVGAEILPTGEVVPVPEPVGVGMLALGGLGLLSRRRRRAACHAN